LGRGVIRIENPTKKGDSVEHRKSICWGKKKLTEKGSRENRREKRGDQPSLPLTQRGEKKKRERNCPQGKPTVEGLTESVTMTCARNACQALEGGKE